MNKTQQRKIEITDINENKINIVFNPIMFNKLIVPKYLHDNNLKLIENKSISIMTHLCLN